MSGKQMFSASLFLLVFMYFVIFFITFMYVRTELFKSNLNLTPVQNRVRRKHLIILFIVSTIPLLNMFLPPYVAITSFIKLIKLLRQEFVKVITELFRRLPR